jgi:hypothetical protein
MLDHVFDLYSDLERHRVMLSFKGNLTPELVTALLGLVQKRVFNVVMECLQNLYHHNAQRSGTDAVRTDDAQGVVMIAQTDKGYSVLTGNFMAEGEVERLKEHLDHVNALAPDELRDLYKEKLADGRYSASGGGGLGLIDIARRSGNKLEYGFVPFDTQSTFFSLNVNVPV